jgi:hypothetical protein
MIPEVLSSRLAAIQSSMDQGNLAHVLDSKLGTTNNVILQWAWRLQIGIPYVCGKHINPI